MPPHEVTFFHDDDELPLPVAWDRKTASLVDTTAPTPGETNVTGKANGITSVSHCKRRVRFAESSPQVRVIHLELTEQQKEELWYTAKEYHAFLQEAGLIPPTRRASPLPKTTWIVRTLWIGSLVMGVLATTTFSGSESKRETR